MQPSGISAFLLTLLLLAAPVPAGLWLVGVAERAWGERSASLALVVVLTAWCALHTALGLGLGMAGLFARGPLALAEGALLGVGWAALRRGSAQAAVGGLDSKGPRDQEHPRDQEDSKDEKGPRDERNPRGTSAGRNNRRSRSSSRFSLFTLHSSLFTLHPSSFILHSSSLLSRWELALVGALVAMAGAHFVALAAQPTWDWDSVAFHLPPMFHWIQTGTLGIIRDIAVERLYRYPFGGELLDALFVLPYRSDFLAALPNLVSWILLGAGVHASARLLGARRLPALAAGALLLGFPFVARHIATMHVDVTMAAHFAAALALGLAWVRRPSAGAAAPVALAVGLLLGTRLSAPAHLLALFGAAAALAVTRALSPAPGWAKTGALGSCLDNVAHALAANGGFRPRYSRRATWRVFAGATLVALLVGNFWYARNWAEVGTPFGLVRVRLAGLDFVPRNVDPRQVLEPEAARQSTVAHLFRPTRREDWAILGDMVRTELGWPFVALALTAAAGGAVVLARGDGRRRALLAILFALFAVTFWLYTIVPNSGAWGPSDHMIPWCKQAIRYGLSALAVLAVLGAVGASALRVPGAVCGAMGCAACIWGATLPEWPGKQWGWAAATGVAGVAAGAALLGRRTRRDPWDKWGVRLACASAALILFGASIHRLHREHEVRRSVVYKGLTEYVDEKIPSNETISQLVCAFVAPLYGSHLSHRVVSACAIDDAPVAWVERLRRDGVRRVAVGPLPPEVWQFDYWAGKLRLVLAPDGPFVREFGRDPKVEPVLYRLRDSPAGRPVLQP